jgi:hypothetical protein
VNQHPARPALAAICAAMLALLSAGIVSAHTVRHAGPYSLEIGWQHEPTYVGEANGVQMIVHDASGKGITDLTTDDVKVVVSTGGQQTGQLTFAPGFDLEEQSGTFGEYNAPIMPTAPGDYTFHITGSIHGQAVDIIVTSSDQTFDTVRGTTDIQFPMKLPTLTEIVTRLDRIDARQANNTGPTQAAVNAAQASANDAHQAADRALLVGGGIGLAGLVVGAWSLVVARRQATAKQA